jgi:hypothetical protein
MNFLVSLERLILSSNRIHTIPPVAEDFTHSIGIKNLALSFNDLREWTDIDSLSRWCPTLETLSLRGNPLVEGADQHGTWFIVHLIRTYRSADWAVRTATRHFQDTFTKNFRCGRRASVLRGAGLF